MELSPLCPVSKEQLLNKSIMDITQFRWADLNQLLKL